MTKAQQGTLLRAARKRAGLTQPVAAERCGVSFRSWVYYEAGTVSLSGRRLKAHLAALSNKG